MCKCCDDIQAWQENLNENKTNAKIFSTLVIYRWKEGEKNSWKAKRKNDFISVCTKLLPCMWKEAIISYKFKNNYNEFIALNPSKIYLSKS